MHTLIKYKIYFQRSTIYISIFNSALIFSIFTKTMGLPGYFIPIGFIAGVGLMFVVGYLDHKHVLERENKMLYDKTPQIMDILKKK